MAEESLSSVDSDIKLSLKRERDDEEEMYNPTKQLQYLVCLGFLSKEDARLLCDFLSSHPVGCLRDDALSFKTKGFAYSRLAELLRLLNGHTVLELADSRSFAVSELLHDLRHFSFSGTWLDSLERVFASSCSHVDISCRSLRNLLVSEDRLSEDAETLRSKVNSLRLQMERCEAELVRVREKKKAVLQARAALDVPFTFWFHI